MVSFLYLMLLCIIAVPLSAQNSVTEQEVTFTNGSVELSGTFIRPDLKEKVPAVVFVQGSGAMDRSFFRFYAEQFAQLGIASLFYDKRGTGSSGGSWTTSSLDDLASDVVAAIEFLKDNESIISDKIGVWGVSQAGWVTSLVSSKTSDIAFMIMNSGGGVTPEESELYSFRKIFEMFEFDEESKEKAFQILNKYYEYLDSGIGREELVEVLDQLKSNPENPLTRLANMIYLPSTKNRENWEWVSVYDPMPAIEKMKFPILLLFGKLDTNHPTDLALKRWKEGLEKAGNNQVTTIVFPEAGHGIRLGAMHNMNAPLADGYMEVQYGWLWDKIIKLKKK